MMLGFLITLLLFCVVIWAARTLMAAWGLPQPIQTTIYVIIVVLVVFWLVQQLPAVIPTLKLTR